MHGVNFTPTTVKHDTEKTNTFRTNCGTSNADSLLRQKCFM